MHSYTRAIAVAATTFCASIVGMALQWVVPAQVLTEAKGPVGAMVGLVTLLLALVLGLLVFTAFSVYTTQQAEAYSLGPVVIELDVVLEQYGPEAIRGRVRLREALGRSRRGFFGDVMRGPQAHTFEETRATMHWMNTYFDSLQPSTERQRQLLTSARDLAKNFAQTQMLMTRQLASQSFSALCVGRGGLLGLGALSRQWTGRGAECGLRGGASGGRDRRRQRGLPDPRTEPALHRRGQTLLRRPRPAASGSWRSGREGGRCERAGFTVTVFTSLVSAASRTACDRLGERDRASEMRRFSMPATKSAEPSGRPVGSLRLERLKDIVVGLDLGEFGKTRRAVEPTRTSACRGPTAFTHLKLRVRIPSPALLGKVARSAGWGMARCIDPSRIARTSARTCNDPYLLSTPHPALRAAFPASRRRGGSPTAFNSTTCVNLKGRGRKGVRYALRDIRSLRPRRPSFALPEPRSASRPSPLRLSPSASLDPSRAAQALCQTWSPTRRSGTGRAIEASKSMAR